MALSGWIFPKYHPEIRWKEISGGKFIVVFPRGYEEEAVYTLETAKQLHEQLSQLWGDWVQIHGKTRILLSDSYDDSNGSATFFPYNQVEIYLLTPPPDSTIGNAKEWIRIALAHEMTHIFNFNAGCGFTYFLRKFLGANPLLYPTLVMPVWLDEGLAVYAESKMDEGGRLNTPDFKLMLHSIAGGGNMPGWDSIWGNPTPWPGSTAKYLYGATFIDFLAKTYGHAKLPEFIKTFAYHPLSIVLTKDLTPVKLTVRQRFKKAFGKSLSTLWNQFLQQTGSNSPDTGKDNNNNPGPGPVTFLTRNGKFKKYPLLTRDKELFYVNQNYQEYPGIYRLDIETGQSQRLIEQTDISGMFYWEPGHTIYFSAVDYYKSFYRYSDIYALDTRSKEVKRLSTGGRLFYPTRANRDENKIYCVKRKRNQSYLAVLDLNTRRSKILSEGYAAMAYPAISPDNRYMAVSLKRKREDWAIALFDLEGRLINIITEGRGKCYAPAWKNPEELFFICRHQDSYKLAGLDLRDHSFTLYDDPRLPALRYITPPPGENREQIAASVFAANGFNLALLNLQELKKTTPEANPESPSPSPDNRENPGIEPTSPPPPTYRPKSYNYLREMFPKYIIGAYRSGGNEAQPGILIGSHDLLMQHSFTTEIFYGLRSKTVNFVLNYTFDGLYPSLSLRYSDLSEFNHSPGLGDFIHKERKFEMIGLVPLSIRERSQSYLYSNLHFETAGDDLPDLPPGSRVKLNGMKLGFFFNSARRYYDSISQADGIGFSLSYSREFKWMGSDYEINSAAFQYKHYLSLGRPNVLALRFGLMDSWGEARRLFYMGGAKPQEDFQPAGSSIFDLMRGYPSGYFSGTGGCLLNIEYRMSLFKIERVFFSISSIDRLYLSLFADIGNVWNKKWKIDPAYSLGLELNLILVFSDVRINAASGLAVGQNPHHSPVLYFRIGHAF